MQLESVCDTMSSQVASDSEVLEELRKAMHESVQRFNDNIRVVDERIRGLR
jgi:regulator of protease activity HflC (stomatin/prohibitin superfamily)